MGAFSKLFSRLRITSDPNVGTQTSAVIQADSTNSSLVLAPNGTGAIIASIPDGTATGGNARGAGAVDLQTSRTANTQVASGTGCTISGGSNNRATNTNSVVGGGLSNAAANNYTTISGGQTNTATELWAMVIGGASNTASGVNAIAGGNSNNVSSRAGVGFGDGNIVSGRACVAIGDGNNNAGVYSACFGLNNIVNSACSLTSGNGVKSYLLGQFAHTSIFINNRGNNQCSIVNAGIVSSFTTGSTATLSLDGSGTTNLLIPDGIRSWNVQVNWVALVTAITGTATGISVGDTITGIDSMAFRRIGGTSSISTVTLLSTNSIVTTGAAYTASAIAYSVGASQELSMVFTGPVFTGGGTITMRINARVELTEIANN